MAGSGGGAGADRAAARSPRPAPPAAPAAARSQHEAPQHRRDQQGPQVSHRTPPPLLPARKQAAIKSGAASMKTQATRGTGQTDLFSYRRPTRSEMTTASNIWSSSQPAYGSDSPVQMRNLLERRTPSEESPRTERDGSPARPSSVLAVDPPAIDRPLQPTHPSLAIGRLYSLPMVSVWVAWWSIDDHRHALVRQRRRRRPNQTRHRREHPDDGACLPPRRTWTRCSG